jgi:flavin reductase (DIM6/NTAB) family NADH-FMN oxidoreductase RutF
MTLSSFTTLSLTQSPIVTFNIRAPSRTLDALKHTRHFLIHVLSATKRGANVADAFTKGAGADAFKSVHFRHDQAHVKQRLAEKQRGEEQTVLPVIISSGVMRVLRCEVLGGREGEQEGFVKAGDHVLVLAKVHQILPRAHPRIPYNGGERCAALSYAYGKYRRLGSATLW